MQHKAQKRLYTVIILSFFAAIVISLVLISIASNSLRPVFFGVAIAYIFKPMCNVFQRWYKKLFMRKFNEVKSKKLAHYFSMVTTYLVWGAIICVFFSIVLPKLVGSIVATVSTIPKFIEALTALANDILANTPWLSRLVENMLKDVSLDLDYFYTQLKPYISGITSGTLGFITGTVSFIFNVFVGFVISVYLLNGRKKLCAQAKLLIRSVFGRKNAEIIFEEVRFADKMFSSYFIGSIIDSTLVGVLCYIGCLIMRAPYAVLVSVIVGVTNMIPFFGPYIGMIPSAIIILTVSPIHAVMFLVMMIIMQQIDGNILAPKIIGSNTGLSSFWVLFAILLFSGLFGFIGMIIGVPIFAVIYDVCGKLIRYCLHRRGEVEPIKDYESEFPREPEESKPSMIERIKSAREAKEAKRSKEKTAGTAEESISGAPSDESEEIVEIEEIGEAEGAYDDEELSQVSFFEEQETK